MAHALLQALTIGLFASMLVAKLTSVTHGHSGRPLDMVTVARIAFVGMQATAIVRVAADAARQPLLWYMAAAVMWLAVLAPWAGRSSWLYLPPPRKDGRPG